MTDTTQMKGIAEGRNREKFEPIVSRLPERRVWGVEVGVHTGSNASLMLEAHEMLTLTLVDPFYDMGLTGWTASPPQTGQRWTADQWERLYRSCQRRMEKWKNRAHLFRGTSEQAAGVMKDEAYDFVFVDGDHTYEGCALDIRLWWPKVKPGGFLSGHDYDEPNPNWGVKRAVDEFMATTDLALELDRCYTWFVRKPTR